jgi:hypothetical protein
VSCCSLHGMVFSMHVLVLVNWIHGQLLLFPYSCSVPHAALFTCSGLSRYAHMPSLCYCLRMSSVAFCYIWMFYLF